MAPHRSVHTSPYTEQVVASAIGQVLSMYLPFLSGSWLPTLNRNGAFYPTGGKIKN
jgi:hypothetical protein